MTEEDKSSEKKEAEQNSDESRRNLLKIGLGLGTILAIGGTRRNSTDTC